MKNLIFFAILCSTIGLAQQREWLVSINPTTGSFSKIDSFPGIKYIQSSPPFHTIDKVNGRFYFSGSNSSTAGTFSLCSANTSNGKVRRHGPAPSNLGNLVFDDSTGFIYALTIFNSPLILYKIDTSNAFATPITTLSSYSSPQLNNTTYNQQKHQLITTAVISSTAGSIFHLLTISVLSGSIVNSVSITPGVFPYFIRYNNATKKLYGMLSSGNGTISIAEINMQTGQYTPLSSVSSETLNSLWPPDRGTINEMQNSYSFRGPSSPFKLYTFDLTNGALLSSPNFSIGSPVGSNDNIIEFQYNNLNGMLYGLHWGPSSAPTETLTTEIKKSTSFENSMDVFPNPAINKVHIRFSSPTDVSQVIITNIEGKVVSSFHGSEICSELVLPEIPPGIYFAEATQNERKLIRKFILLP